jgi:hypothetical protein
VNAPETKPRLEYDRSTPTVSRRQFRFLLMLTLMNTTMLGWFIVGPQASAILKEQWQQWKDRQVRREIQRKVLAAQQECLEHAYPADLVIYEERPAEARRLVADVPGYSPVAWGGNPGFFSYSDWVPPALLDHNPLSWSKFAPAYTEGGMLCDVSLPVLFMGERKTPGGRSRLVVVQCDMRQTAQTTDDPAGGKITHVSATRWIGASVFEPPAPNGGDSVVMAHYGASFALHLLTPPSVAHMTRGQWQLERRGTLTLRAGQRDPDDSTHFTVPFRVDQTESVIDGWLGDEGLLIKPRIGHAAVTAEGARAWELIGPPRDAASTQKSS